jgi:ABC-type transport system substrate-binding protein
MKGFIRQPVMFYAWCLLLLFIPGCPQKGDEGESSGSVFRFPLRAKIKSLDSGNVEDVYGMQVCSQIFESLYTYHYLKRPFVLEPLLADGMPVVSDDKLTYTIKIKQGVYFHDDPCFPDGKGRELKAEDFVFAFKRIANIRYASPNWGTLKDRIVGLDDFREYTKQFKNAYEVDYNLEVEGFKALDDYTLQINLLKPWPQLIDNLTSAVTAPVPHEAVDFYRKDMIAHPIGTGPFRLKKWHRGVYIELIKNPTFREVLYPTEGMPENVKTGFLEDAGKPLPFIDRILFSVMEE